MNEKFVKVEVLVDTTNPEQLGALGAFLSTVGGVTIPIPVEKTKAEDLVPPQPEPEKPPEPPTNAELAAAIAELAEVICGG